MKKIVNVAALLATAYGLQVGRVAVADDWLGSRGRIMSSVNTSLPSVTRTRNVGRSSATVIRGQNIELPESQKVFGIDAPRYDGFGMSSDDRGLSTRMVDIDAPHPLSQPNIEEPGPDSPDFPDSAFTVHPGVVYFETSVTTESSKGPRVRDYFTDTLIRVGLWENWELRISSPGLIQEDGPGIDTTGFGPLTLGFKHHVWAEDDWIPAFGIIAQVTTPTASAGFDNGAAEPTLFFNFDHTLPYEFAFEWNAGISWLKGNDGDRFVQGEILWGLGRELAPHVEGFVHGIVDFPAPTGEDDVVVIGPGITWVVSDRVMLDTSYNFGLTNAAPQRIIRFGMSMAF